MYHALNFNEDRDKKIFRKIHKLWMIVRAHVGNRKNEENPEPHTWLAYIKEGNITMCTEGRKELHSSGSPK